MTQKPNPDQATLSDEELELLYRTAEATERVDDRVERTIENTKENAQDIQEIRGRVKRNTTILGGITGGLGMVLMWAADKVSRFV